MLFDFCHEWRDGFQQKEWPDGKPLLKQAYYTIQVFEVIKDEKNIRASESLKRRNG
jgi:hypothetical protein